jgi:hypothetical protein
MDFVLWPAVHPRMPIPSPWIRTIHPVTFVATPYNSIHHVTFVTTPYNSGLIIEKLDDISLRVQLCQCESNLRSCLLRNRVSVWQWKVGHTFLHWMTSFIPAFIWFIDQVDHLFSSKWALHNAPKQKSYVKEYSSCHRNVPRSRGQIIQFHSIGLIHYLSSEAPLKCKLQLLESWGADERKLYIAGKWCISA